MEKENGIFFWLNSKWLRVTQQVLVAKLGCNKKSWAGRCFVPFEALSSTNSPATHTN